MRSAMAAGQPSSGKSPVDQQPQRGPTEREQTPEGPKKGEQPKPDPDPKGQDQQQPGEKKPDDKGKNPPGGENRSAPPRVDDSGPPVAPGDDAERWGFLPERVQQVFRNQITDDPPVQYRDWIDAYYRRLNRGR